MPKANTQWKVGPHAPIEKLTDNLWRVEASLPKMPLKRVMTLARLADGRIVVHNGVALDDDAMRAVEAWGEPTWLLVPNGYHRLDAPAFKARYPKIRVLCPRGARKKVEQVVAVDGTYDDFSADANVSLEHLASLRDEEGVMRVRSADGVTLVLNDFVFNMPHLPGSHGWVLRHVTGSSGGPRVSRLVRWFLMRDKSAARADLERLAATPDLVRVVVSHHETIATRPAEVLREIAAAL
jgi:hypothetical protein